MPVGIIPDNEMKLLNSQNGYEVHIGEFVKKFENRDNALDYLMMCADTERRRLVPCRCVEGMACESICDRWAA